MPANRNPNQMTAPANRQTIQAFEAGAVAEPGRDMAADCGEQDTGRRDTLGVEESDDEDGRDVVGNCDRE